MDIKHFWQNNWWLILALVIILSWVTFFNPLSHRHRFEVPR